MWAPPLLLIASGILGLLFSIPTGSVGTPYLIAFFTAAVVGTLFVVARGLTVTVAQIPLLFTIITPLVAWYTGSFADMAVGGVSASTPFKTRVITAAYPVIQFFPWMVLITLTTLAIAIWRYVETKRTAEKYQKLRRKDVRRQKEVNQRTARHASEARQRTVRAQQRQESKSAQQLIEESRRRRAERDRLYAQRQQQRLQAQQRRAQRQQQAPHQARVWGGEQRSPRTSPGRNPEIRRVQRPPQNQHRTTTWGEGNLDRPAPRRPRDRRQP